MMRADTGRHEARPGRSREAVPFHGAAALAAGGRYTSHGRAALAAAFDTGLMREDLTPILARRRVVDAFPVARGETPAAYAARAVSEMFVLYLA